MPMSTLASPPDSAAQAASRGARRARKLGCNRCCQGIFTVEANGTNVCSCIPSGSTCDPQSSAACCSGYCDGTSCQTPPDSACSLRCTGCCEGQRNVSGRNQHRCLRRQWGELFGLLGTTPICQSGTCVSCTSTTQCPTGQMCLPDGSCLACDVTCPSGSTPAACGTALQAAISAGRYALRLSRHLPGQFQRRASVSLFGAGEGQTLAATPSSLPMDRQAHCTSTPGSGSSCCSDCASLWQHR